MYTLNPWPIFPSTLEPPVVRSLSLQFILQTVLQTFEIIAPLQTTNDPPNPFLEKGNVLDKLCFYSEILLQASEKSHGELALILEEMMVISTKLKMLHLKSKTQNPEPAKKIYERLFEGAKRYFQTLIPFLRQARSDENVLTYLIEKKELFNRFLGKREIENLLQSFFPSGHDQLRALIHEGYTRRGFSPFLSSIEPLIDAIQWEIACHCPTKR